MLIWINDTHSPQLPCFHSFSKLLFRTRRGKALKWETAPWARNRLLELLRGSWSWPWSVRWRGWWRSSGRPRGRCIPRGRSEHHILEEQRSNRSNRLLQNRRTMNVSCNDSNVLSSFWSVYVAYLAFYNWQPVWCVGSYAFRLRYKRQGRRPRKHPQEGCGIRGLPF